MNAFIWWNPAASESIAPTLPEGSSLFGSCKGRLIGEDVFVEFTGAKTAVSAVNEVTVVSCSVEELFPYIVESEALLRAILRHLTGTNISLTRHLKRIAIYDSRQKVASYLYEETREDSPSRNIVDHVLPYSHDQLSVCLGLNRADRQPGYSTNFGKRDIFPQHTERFRSATSRGCAENLRIPTRCERVVFPADRRGKTEHF